jgi:hypothetical protein
MIDGSSILELLAAFMKCLGALLGLGVFKCLSDGYSKNVFTS